MSNKIHTSKIDSSQRCPVTCTEAGCAQVSNGIAPYEKCPEHFARYQAYRAQLQWLEDLIRRSLEVESVAADTLTLLEGSQDGEIDGGNDRDGLAGAVMDLIRAGSSHAGGSRVAPPAAARALRNVDWCVLTAASATAGSVPS